MPCRLLKFRLPILVLQGNLKRKQHELTVGSGLMIDQEADVKQTGNAVIPIVGLNLAFLDDDLIISAKYEFFTKMDLNQ